MGVNTGVGEDYGLLTDRSLGWVRESEQPFVRKARDWTAHVRRDVNWRRTDFLSPREQRLLLSVARHEGCIVRFYGGSEHCERARALVMPDDWMPEHGDFGVKLLQVESFGGDRLSHGAVLGSLLGTGVDRRKVGDIEVDADRAVVAVCEELESFLRLQWTQVGRAPVSLSEASSATFQGPAYETAQIQVASKRMDALLAACCHWSRGRAKDEIVAGNVTLNFMEFQRIDEEFEVGDIVSVRGFGRIRVMEEQGESRKGRIRMEVGVVRSGR